MHVAAMVVGCPPCSEWFEFGFGHAVGDGEGEAQVVAHGFDFVEGSDGRGNDVCAEGIEFVDFLLVAT